MAAILHPYKLALTMSRQPASEVVRSIMGGASGARAGQRAACKAPAIFCSNRAAEICDFWTCIGALQPSRVSLMGGLDLERTWAALGQSLRNSLPESG